MDGLRLIDSIVYKRQEETLIKVADMIPPVLRKICVLAKNYDQPKSMVHDIDYQRGGYSLLETCFGIDLRLIMMTYDRLAKGRGNANSRGSK